jgi:uncharacterized membrane protein YccF (DUF307 family)
MLRFLLNVLWFVLGGVVMGLGWWLAGLVAAVTIVGIPWARACFVIGNYSFSPVRATSAPGPSGWWAT